MPGLSGQEDLELTASSGSSGLVGHSAYPLPQRYQARRNTYVRVQEMAESIKHTEELFQHEAKSMMVKTSSPAQDALQNEQHQFLLGILKELTQKSDFLHDK